MGTLYIVATPIGNLEDITLRALRVLAEVPLIAAEDTRTTRVLLDRHGISTRLTAYTEHNRRGRIPMLLAHLETADLALVSEAGTPLVSDPGAELVGAAIAAGHTVVPVPGPAAPVSALVASGLPARGFLFLGFLPRTSGERRTLLASLARLPYTLLAFESPHRLRATMADALAVLGDRRTAIARELTKLHEEIFRGTLSAAIAHFAAPRGEFTLVIEGWSEQRSCGDLDGALVEVARLVSAGHSARDAVAEAAAINHLSRRRLYAAWLRQAR
jgi:16S rRNA (cytidine1402-2'-O)-methyltransferase